MPKGRFGKNTVSNMILFVTSTFYLIKTRFEAEEYYHVGDRDDLDRKYAIQAGFGFFWPDEAAENPLLL